MRIRYYTETVIQIFKTYTESCIRCCIRIISRILTDSYRGNKREYGLHVFIESLYNEYGKIIQKIYRKIFFCIQPYSVRIRENTVKKNPYSRWFHAALAFCNYVIFGIHIPNISKTVFPKLIFHLPFRYQPPDVLLNEFDMHSTYVINHCI